MGAFWDNMEVLRQVTRLYAKAHTPSEGPDSKWVCRNGYNYAGYIT